MSKRIVWVMLALCALVLAQSRLVMAQERVQEEFHQTYQFAPQGRVQLENINGNVRITGWDRNEVKVDAIKSAYARERLQEVEINVEPGPDNIRISTEYRTGNQTFNNNDNRLNNPASVEFTIFVPRGARIDSVEVVNGNLMLEGLTNDVHASSVNGNVTARGLLSEAKLSTVNGNLEAFFGQLDANKSIALTSVNGSLTVTIPSDANANLRASNLHGGIENDFGLPVRKGEYMGYDLAGQLGAGATRIKLTNVNGLIAIRRAKDGRSVSPATNLLTMREEGKNKPNKEEMKEAMQEARAAQLEVARAQRDAARATREVQRDVERTSRDIRDVQNATANINPEMGFNTYRVIDRDSRSFPVKGTPRVTVETFDGPITVRAWDKQEVSYTTTKRAFDAENMQGIRVNAEQRGDEVFIRVEFDKATADRLGNVRAETMVDIFVPRNANLRISSGDGRVSVEGVSGEVNARTGDGSVDVRDSKGNLVVATGDGRIRIQNFDGSAQASTGDGSISLDGRFSRLNAKTGDGTISLALASDTNATVETDAESVYNDGVATGEDDDETKRVRRWRIGNGGTLYTLKAGEGRVLLRRAQ
jgi:DUF4097 and DUF4098 domain-containing protein YvlB